MPVYKWDSSLTYARSHVWTKILLSVLETYKLQSNDNLLEMTHNDQSVLKDYLGDKTHQGDIDVINVKSKRVEFFEALDSVSEHYHSIFCFLYFEELHFDFSILLEYLLKALRPGHRLVLALPFINLHTSARQTFQQVIDSGEFPELTPQSLIHNTTILPRIESEIKTHSHAYHIHTHKSAIELPSLDFFRDYLNEVAFIYKKVVPMDLNNKIIERQAEYYEAINKKENPGKYLFHYQLNVIDIVK